MLHSPTRHRPSIVVDARFIRGSGIARYLREVLVRLLEDDRFGSATLLGDADELREFLSSRGAPRVTARVLPLSTGFYSPRMQLEWSLHRLRGRLDGDVAFFPHYDAPLLLRAARTVVTVQDLTHFMVPDLFPRWKRAVASAVLERVVKTATRVLVTSRSTASDLVARVPSAAAKLHYIPLGVGEPFVGPAPTVPPEIEQLRPYLLYVGNRKPHKNVDAAVEALALLREEDRGLRLVVAGRTFPGWESTLRRARELGVESALTELTEVSDQTLHFLYSRCEALLFPSLYEGFGLPVLEAMACDAPVVASNRASLPEVVGDAGLLVDPTRPDEVAAALRRVRADPSLRRTLVERGRARAAALTWESTAAQTVDFLFRTAVAPAAAPVSE